MTPPIIRIHAGVPEEFAEEELHPALVAHSFELASPMPGRNTFMEVFVTAGVAVFATISFVAEY